MSENQNDSIGEGDALDTDQAGASTSRRDALKKAAAAGAVGAAVWMAPKVDGMSVVPDYAAAGTSTTGVITFRLNGNNPGILGGNNWMNAAPSPAYTITQNGPSDNQAIILTAPLGAAGNAVYTFPAGQDTDGPGVTASVTFNVDPPFNRCVVLGGRTDWEGSTSDRGTLNFGASGNQSPNTTSPRTVTVTTGGGSPSAGNNFFNPITKLNWIEVDIQCQ
jgi:hypothetical protein